MATEIKTLEQALVSYTDFSQAEILYANTSSVYVGILEQLKNCFDHKRVEAAAQSLAKGLGIRLASSKDIEAVDIKKITNPEVHRLMLRLKAIPLGVDSKKNLHLATFDPLCEHTITCFSKFFSCQVLPVLAWETDIQKKLMYAVEGSGTFRTLTDSTGSMPILDAKMIKDSNLISAFENILTEAFKFGTTTLELEFEKKKVLFSLFSSAGKKTKQSIDVDSEDFVTLLLSNSRLIEITQNGFSAWAKLKLFKQNFTYKVSFFKSYSSENNKKNNVIVLSDFSTSNELTRLFLPLKPNLTGIFFVEGSKEVLLQVLKKTYPAAYSPSFGELQSCAKFAASCPIFVSVVKAAELLPGLSAQVLQQVAGILHVEQIQQNCGFCGSQSNCTMCRAFSAKYNLAWFELLKIDNERARELKESIDPRYFSLQSLTEELDSIITKPDKSIPMTESPLFYKPPKDTKMSGFHSVVLNMGEDLLSLRDKMKKE